MARNMAPVLKTCRSLDINPAFLGIYKESKRGAAKAQHRKKISEYGLQLREKQRVKFVYGVLEKQFRLTYEKARSMKGITGESLLMLLELRLDNIMFRLSVGDTRRQARQIVTHGHVLVNGKKVDIPSYRVREGDVITVSAGSLSSPLFKSFLEQPRIVPTWLERNEDSLGGKVARLPRREDIDLPFNENLIVELYSK